jgi:hypothetical protein
MPILNESHFFERSRVNMSVFILNPCLEMISVGKKLFAKKEERRHRGFLRLPPNSGCAL